MAFWTQGVLLGPLGGPKALLCRKGAEVPPTSAFTTKGPQQMRRFWKGPYKDQNGQVLMGNQGAGDRWLLLKGSVCRLCFFRAHMPSYHAEYAYFHICFIIKMCQGPPYKLKWML